MRNVTVTIAGINGPQNVTAWTTETPGLVVNKGIGNPCIWVITHQQSGRCIETHHDPETAQKAAAELATVTDWTQTAEQLATEQHTVQTVFNRRLNGATSETIERFPPESAQR